MIASAAVLAACQAAPVAPQAAAPAATPAAAETDAEGVKVASADVEVVCRSLKVTGTRFAQRECKTPDAWEAYDEYTTGNARESTNNFQRVRSGCSTQSQGTC
jgi:hypothetical protein